MDLILLDNFKILKRHALYIEDNKKYVVVEIR